MSLPRIYQASPLVVNAQILLDEQAARHLVQVLRLKPNAAFILFNGDGNDYHATLITQSKRQYAAQILAQFPSIPESNCAITLGQGISRGEKMDYAIQKAVELGVYAIQPLITTRIALKLDTAHFAKRQQHWQGVAISACEQSGRGIIPSVNIPIPLEKWLPTCTQDLRLVLDPTASDTLSTLPTSAKTIALLIGPEGGLTDEEITQARQQEFQAIQLGPRILRTETAAVAAMTLLQYQWGDI